MDCLPVSRLQEGPDWTYEIKLDGYRLEAVRSVVEPGEQIALSQVSDRSAVEMLKFVKSHGLEGAVAKRSDSVYQPSQRTGLWSKYRINLGQEFVVGGYIPSHLGVDSLVVGSTVARTSPTPPG